MTRTDIGPFLLIFAMALTVAVVVTPAVKRLAHRYSVLDAPSSRKIHSNPMPKINGVEAIAYFRANYPRVPVIVLTGFPDADMATSMLRQGVVDYLVKPVEGEKLRESVARAMEQRELAHL